MIGAMVGERDGGIVGEGFGRTASLDGCKLGSKVGPDVGSSVVGEAEGSRVGA